DEREQYFVPPFRTVDIPRTQLRCKAVAFRVEDKERVIADGLEVSVVRGLLLRSVNGALRTVDVKDHAPRARAYRRMLDQIRVQASQSLVVPLLREDVGLEPVERGGERDARVSSLPRCQHPKRGVLGQSFRVVRVLVAGQAPVDGLAKEIRQGELVVA